MNHHTVRFESSFFVASLVLTAAAGCAPVDDDADPVAQPIINGTTESAEGAGHVRVNLPNGRFCSGTLVANQWVLTAKHCVENLTPTSVNVAMGSQSAAASQLTVHPTLDAAMIKLSAPLTMNGSRYFYHRAFYGSSNASLLNQTLTCHGYGNNTPTTGAGTLRVGVSRVTAVQGDLYTVNATTGGQIPFSGDSGGSCFTSTGALTGVQSTCRCIAKPGTRCVDDNNQFIPQNVLQVVDCNQVGAASIRDWATATINPVPGAFTAIWQQSTSNEIQLYGATYPSYRAQYDQLWTQGWRLHLLQPYVANGQVLYNAVWRPGTGGEIQLYGATYQSYRAQYDQLWTQGWRLKLLQPYVLNGQVYYTAAWRPSTAAEVQLYGATYSSFRAQYDQLWTQGWRLFTLRPYTLNGQVYYTAVWRSGTYGEYQVYSAPYNDYRQRYDDLWAQGWRLTALVAQ